MKKQRPSETLVMLCLLCALAYLWFPHKSRQVLWSDHSFAFLSRPFQEFFTNTKTFFSGMGARVSDASALKTENAKLLQQLQDTQMENLVLRHQLENAAQNRLGFAVTSEPLPVKILAQDPFLPSKSIFVNAGSDHGVKVNDILVAPSGLAGLVIRVLSSSSQVLLLTDPHFRVDAMSTKSKNRILVSGVDADRLQGRNYPLMAQSEFLTDGRAFTPGEDLVTSGFGDIFPAGIPVGRVFSIHSRGKESFLNAEIIPAVDFVKMNALYILRQASHLQE